MRKMLVAASLALGVACARKPVAPSAAVVGTCPRAEAAFPDAGEKAAPFDLAASAGFTGYEAAVRAFATQTQPKQAGDYCAIGFASGNAWRLAWVMGGGHVAAWSGGEAAVGENRDLDLSKDVVATEDDLHGSTYWVTQKWVEGMTTACRCFGRRVAFGGRRRTTIPGAATASAEEGGVPSP